MCFKITSFCFSIWLSILLLVKYLILFLLNLEMLNSVAPSKQQTLEDVNYQNSFIVFSVKSDRQVLSYYLCAFFVCVFVHMCMQTQQSNSDTVLQTLCTLVFETAPLIGLELPSQARLAHHQAQESLSLPPSTGITSTHHMVSFLHGGWNQTQVLMFAWQAL